MSRRGGVLRAVAQAQRAAEREQRAQIQAATRALRDNERARLQQERARAVDERERRRLYVEERVASVDEYNERLNEQVSSLNTLLADSLKSSGEFSLDRFKRSAQLPVFDPGPAYRDPAPQIEDFLPAKPYGLKSLLPGASRKYQEAVALASARFEEERQYHNDRAEAWRKKFELMRLEHENRCAALRAEAQAHCDELDLLASDYIAGTPQAVTSYLSLAVTTSEYPDGFTQQAKLAFVPESNQLVLEYELPDYTIIPEVAAYKYVKQRDEVLPTPRAAAQRKALYASVICQIALRTLLELFQADASEHVQVIVFNGLLDAVDPATGRAIRPCLVTVRATREIFTRLDLSRVDPAACLRSLNASVSKSPTELAPVRPVLEFSMVDPRFIEQTNVLATLDQRPNLMELTPNEFEGLISNLFQKMGLETRQTQASRDGGVDCVAFDTRPIFGGKVVIQAKRYKHTVGVSAVRDLFGTLQNEGASKGILVTTSGYGKAAFDFASGKPLELLSGSNLLALLAEHAGLEARIEAPPEWKDPEPDSLPD
ncbi:MAG: restriction endonuclease [Chloroflexi bacterium]|nr:restriction endonuclease [Chloroflexota bacterium]